MGPIDENKIRDKIRKLLAKATDGAVTEDEAAACSQKARDLMDEYDLTEESVRERAVGPEMEITSPKYMDPWRRDIIYTAARYFGCYVVFDMRNKAFVLFGLASSMFVANSMIRYLDDTVRRLALEWRRSVDGSRAQLLDFERGCGTRIAHRLKKLGDALVVPVVGQSGANLVVQTDIARGKALAESRMIHRDGRSARSSLKGDGAAAGRAAGDKVALGGQVGSSGGAVRIGK